MRFLAKKETGPIFFVGATAIAHGSNPGLSYKALIKSFWVVFLSAFQKFPRLWKFPASAPHPRKTKRADHYGPKEVKNQLPGHTIFLYTRQPMCNLHIV